MSDELQAKVRQAILLAYGAGLGWDACARAAIDTVADHIREGN